MRKENVDGQLMDREDLHTLYKTSAEMVRHFNSILDKVRIVVITIGIGLFAAYGKLYLDKAGPCIHVLLSSLGLLFVIFMWFLAYHYLTHTESCAKAARDMERVILEKYDIEGGAFININADHENVFIGGKFFKFILDFSTFIVMGIAFLALLIVSLLKMC